MTLVKERICRLLAGDFVMHNDFILRVATTRAVPHNGSVSWEVAFDNSLPILFEGHMPKVLKLVA